MTLSERIILSMDFGSKRIGFAVWDPKARLPIPLAVWHRKVLEKDLSQVKELIEKYNVEILLVGKPINLSEKYTQSTQEAIFWKKQLEARFSLPIYFQDESFSTKEAEKIMSYKKSKKKKEMKDSLAAAIILEEFLREKT